MKITCESCGSKYTIADTKVDGRKVKVRCKNCKAMIIVDGSGEGADVAEAAPKKDAWSVNLTDDDSREMTTSELVAGWKSGLVTTDAYVWKDGMDDWKAVLEVPELKKQLLAAKPLKDDGVVSSAGAGASVGGGDDLFGGPSGPARPAPGGGEDKKATGARNESSVLFSLDALKSGPKDAPKAAAPSIDVFGNLGSTPLLTNNADLLTAPAKDPPPAPAGARMQAPIAAAPSKGKGGLIAAILGGALIIGGGLFFALKGGDEPAVDPAATLEAEKLKAEAAEAQKKAEEAQKKAEEQQKALLAELQKAKEEAAKRGEDPAEAERKKKEELAKQEADAKAAAAAGGTTKPATGTSTTGSTTATKPTETKPAATSGGAAFDVGAAKAALSAAAANAASCAKPGGPTGSGKVQVTFAPSGRVTSAEVISGPFGGTAVGGCVATKFRAARVPAFSGSPQTAAKSFTIN